MADEEKTVATSEEHTIVEEKKTAAPVVEKPAKANPVVASSDVEVEKTKTAEIKKESAPKSYDLPLLFNKYNFEEVDVHDEGLKRYLNLSPVGVPHCGARHANHSFGNMKVSIVERLMNNMMRTERFTGKKTKAYSTVERAFEIIALFSLPVAITIRFFVCLRAS